MKTLFDRTEEKLNIATDCLKELREFFDKKGKQGVVSSIDKCFEKMKKV